MKLSRPIARGLAVPLLLLAASCSDPSTAPEEVPLPPQGPISFDTISEGTIEDFPFADGYFGLEETTLIVIRDQGAWEALWDPAGRADAPIPTPDLDFTAQIVLAVLDRPRGYVSDLSVSALVSGGLELDVEVRRSVGCHWPATTAPFQIVTVSGQGWERIGIVITDSDELCNPGPSH